MRLQLPMLASAGMAAACAIAPSVATAAPHPHYNHNLTIHATPSHIVAGDPVLIYGRFQGPHRADRAITLYHRIAQNGPFTVIGHTRTNAAGLYEFTRAQDVVNTNRSWYVEGPHRSHSLTVHERVAAELTLSASATSGTTRHPLVFSGQVTPGERGGRVKLQVQNGAGNSWRTVAGGRIGPNSTYSISHGWRTAGPQTVRVLFAGDRRNARAASDPVTVVINQRQSPYFSITTSSPLLADGQTAAISGVLDQPHTQTPEPNTAVGLYASTPHSGHWSLVQQGTTGSDGGYTFTVGGTSNELYQVRTMAAPVRTSAVVFQGVQDAVSMSSSATTSTVGGTVTLSGSVAPDKTGHVVYLERLGRDGHWQVVATSTVSTGSTYSFNWEFGAAGTKQFRARVLGGPVNVGGASAPVTITVSQPAVSGLPSN